MQIFKMSIYCIPLYNVFDISGVTCISERLQQPFGDIDDMFVSLSLSGPLMSETQHRKLNPLVLTVHSATDLPDSPLSYTDLQERYMWKMLTCSTLQGYVLFNK